MLQEPTSSQCATHEIVELENGHRFFAAWYPQMGGYGSRCWVSLGLSDDDSDPERCFDCYIWHDGEFPFSAVSGQGRGPSELHHCSAEQFVDFGNLVARFLGSEASGYIQRRSEIVGLLKTLYMAGAQNAGREPDERANEWADALDRILDQPSNVYTGGKPKEFAAT